MMDRKAHFVVVRLVKGSDELTIVSGPGGAQFMSAEDASKLAGEIQDSLNMETFVCQLCEVNEE